MSYAGSSTHSDTSLPPLQDSPFLANSTSFQRPPPEETSVDIATIQKSNQIKKSESIGEIGVEQRSPPQGSRPHFFSLNESNKPTVQFDASPPLDAQQQEGEEQDDEEPPKDVLSSLRSFVKRVWTDSSLLFKFLRLTLLTLVLLTPGLVFHFCYPDVTLDDKSILFWSYTIMLVLMGYFWLFWLLSLIIYVFHCTEDHVFHLSWSGFYYLAESKGYVAFFLYTVLFSLAWNLSPLHTVSLWRESGRQSVNKACFAMALGTIAFAYKNHLVVKMAMSFNYSNYMDRVSDCLFADRMICQLGKSKNLYKVRRRIRLKLHQPSYSIAHQPMTFFTSGPYLSPPSQRPLNDHQTEPPTSNPIETPAPPPPVPPPSGLNDEHTFNPFNVRQDLAAFHKLEQKMMAQFAERVPESEGSDSLMHQSGLRRQARSLASRLYKWLHTTANNNDSRIGLRQEDLANVIVHPADLARLWNMLLHSTTTTTNASNKTPPRPSSIEAPFYQASSPCSSYSKDSTDALLLSSLLATETHGDTDSCTATSVNLSQLSDFIERTYREVIGLAKSLHSMEAAVKKLNICFSILCLLALVIFLALLFGDFLAALTSLSSLVFGAAFMFGSSAKNVFESIIFLFVTHPFDVGDRVYLSLSPSTGPIPPISLPGAGSQLTNASPGSGTLENLIVVEMHLLTTLFERWDGAKIYIPNYVLATRPIVNIRRSGALYDTHRLQIAFTTPMTVLNEFKTKLLAFVRFHSLDYTPNLLFNVEFFENVNRMHVIIMVQHRTNWQDFEAQLARKSKLLMFIKESVELLHISYLPPVQRIEFMNEPYFENAFNYPSIRV